MNRLSSQKGFSAVEGLIILVVVAAIGAAGYMVYNRMQNSTPAPTASQTEQTAPAVNDAKDLDTANKTLDATDIDATAADSAELDTELSSF